MSIVSRSWISRFVDGLIRWRNWLALLGLVLTAAAWAPASQLQFDHSLESLFANDDPVLQSFRRSKQIFGGDEFALLAYADPELNSPEGLERVLELATQVEALPGIMPGSVQNLWMMLKQARMPFVNVPEAQVRDLVRGLLLGADNQTTAVVGRLAPEKTPSAAASPDPPIPPRAETIRRLRKIAADFSRKHGLEVHLVGEPIQVLEAFRYVEEDGLWLWVYSSGLLVFVILILFRSIRWTLLPLVVVAISVLWTRAVLVVSRLELSMVSSMLNSLVTIIGVATVIHIAVQFREARHTQDRQGALRQALNDLALPIFWTALTTAIGFAALISSEISPVRSFGVMMLFGSMAVLPAVMVCVPWGALAGTVGADVAQAPFEDRMNDSLKRLARLVDRAPWTLSLSLLGLTAAAGLGCLWLRVETDFSKNFRANTPIVRGLSFVEERLGGSGTFEVNFPAPEELTEEFLAQVGRLASELRNLKIDGQPALTKVISLDEGEAIVPRNFFTQSLSRRLWLLEKLQPEFSVSLYQPQAHRMRLMLRARERQPADRKLAIIDQVQAIADKHFPGAQTTGLFVLLANLIESLLRDQWVSFALAGIGITGAMWLAFGRLWLALASLAPNVFPILLVLGTMGWIGLPVNIATAMISSVSMGLTVDSSVHFLAGFRRARQRGLDFAGALQETHRDVGRALLFANLALIAGFLVLTASHFIPLVYFGIMVSIAMCGGLIGNLILLPLLLKWGE